MKILLASGIAALSALGVFSILSGATPRVEPRPRVWSKVTLLALFAVLTGCGGSREAYDRFDRNVERTYDFRYNPSTGEGGTKFSFTRAPGQGRRTVGIGLDFKQPVAEMEGITW